MRMRKCSTSGVAGLVFALGLGTAMAQTTAGSAGSAAASAATGAASAQDKKFLVQATDGSLFEIKTSQLALQKSSSDDVKQYAQKMIDDHNTLMTQMKPVAMQANVTPQTDLMEAKHKKEYKQLEGLSGTAFDTQYIKDQTADHQTTVTAFQKEINSGSLPDEKSAAQQGLPIVQGHMQMIQQIAQSHNVTTNTGAM